MCRVDESEEMGSQYHQLCSDGTTANKIRDFLYPAINHTPHSCPLLTEEYLLSGQRGWSSKNMVTFSAT
jgi:hypothetical protein